MQYKGHLINKSSSTGYPTIWINGKNTLVHRLVWEEAHGSIPDDVEIHHTAHNINFNITRFYFIKFHK